MVTAIDGYQMAKQGRAGQALATAALGSFFAGSVATVILALFAPPLANVALEFGPAEYFSLMVLGLVASVALASGSLLKAFTMIVLGLLLGLVGTDVETGTPRFTFDLPELADGLNFVALAMGVFGLGEIIRNLEHEHTRSVMVKSVSGLMLSREDFKRIVGPVLRGTGLGSVLGILPGGGAMLASFAAYTLEKRVSPNQAQFGKGAIEGVAAPEAANNAGAQTSFIPMLTLGIPTNPVMALMIGALIIQGITPGPNVVTDEPALFWGLIVSMWVGNLMLVLLNLPLIGMWVKMLTIPYHLLFPAIIAFCCIGAYSVNNNLFDVYAMAGFGLVGWVLIKLDFEPAPLLLGFVLGPDARGEPAPGDDHLPRRRHRLPHPPAQPRPAAGLRRPPRRRPPPQHPSQTRGSLPGVDRPAMSDRTEANMAIKDLLVHLDETPASTTRLQAALALAAACGAQVSALYLVAEPFMPGMGGRHLPAECCASIWRMLEPEAESGAGELPGPRPSGRGRRSRRCAQRPAGPAAGSCWPAMAGAPT